MSHSRQAHKAYLFLILPLFIVFALMAFWVPEAEARMIACRGDPIVWLSDNTKIHLISDIQVRPRKVVSIDFVVHVPPGLSVSRIKYNDGIIGAKEHVDVIADGIPGQITVDNLVTTQRDPVNVTLRVRATDLGTSHRVNAAEQGQSGQTLTLPIDHP